MFKRWIIDLLIRISGLRNFTIFFLEGEKAWFVNDITVDLEENMIYLEYKERED